MIRAVVLAAVFLSGAALMSLEMAGFRLVQPEFGSDIIVWGSLISVFLGGLAIGAFLGGRLADRRPALWKLGAILALGGVVALSIPLYSDAVLDYMFPGEGAPLPEEWNDGGAGTGDGQLVVYMPPDLRWPTLGVGLLLFLVPAVLLGMVTPYAAKLLIHALGHLGSGVGKISGLSTVGAIVGTLGTTFYLITWMGTRWLLAANGLVLVGLGLALALAHLATPRE
ncbi:MAG TPA: fused MFS/spermidine synthase [Phycisphaerae bacterium]|nr:fused MFS/spermidine synthase [Phycisphaerae bacterium]